MAFAAQSVAKSMHSLTGIIAAPHSSNKLARIKLDSFRLPGALAVFPYLITYWATNFAVTKSARVISNSFTRAVNFTSPILSVRNSE